jgi:hypothetical protein
LSTFKYSLSIFANSTNPTIACVGVLNSWAAILIKSF